MRRHLFCTFPCLAAVLHIGHVEPSISVQTERRKQAGMRPAVRAHSAFARWGSDHSFCNSHPARRMDEPYHIGARVAYVQKRDFCINPEHPPFVKLWVGSVLSATGFRLSSIRSFADKLDERAFAEQNVYLNNDFESVQRRTRMAMWALNGLLVVLFASANASL